MGHESFLQGVICAGTEWFRETGLKFAVAPSKIPTAEIVAAVEESISQLNDDRKNSVRAEVSSTLKQGKHAPKNIQKDVFNALVTLKKDLDRLVSSADMGNCVVVMDNSNIVTKLCPCSMTKVRMQS